MAGLGSFRTGSFQGWLFAIARNVVIDDLRHGGDPPPDLDPALMRMARLVSDLAVVSSGSGKIDTQRTAKAQTWEALMRPAMPPSVTPVVIAFPV